METAARGLKLKVLPVAMASDADVESCSGGDSACPSRRADRTPDRDPQYRESISGARIGELAIRLRIPSITASKALMERGLLMSYGADARDVHDASPATSIAFSRAQSLPICRSSGRPSSSSRINMKTAKAIGLTIPQSLLLRADEVIQ